MQVQNGKEYFKTKLEDKTDYILLQGEVFSPIFLQIMSFGGLPSTSRDIDGIAC